MPSSAAKKVIRIQREDSAFIVLDFETSGLSPDKGHRAIEIGAVLVREGKIAERFQSLMNPGRRISPFIEAYTGITNQMLSNAPEAAGVMEEFFTFIGDKPLVAHNASFDRRFLDVELSRIGCSRRQEFGCSLLAARRIYPHAPNHRLETLIHYKGLPTDGCFHRALADSEMTARLWLCMIEDLRTTYNLREVSFDLMCGLGKIGKKKVVAYLKEFSCHGF